MITINTRKPKEIKPPKVDKTIEDIDKGFKILDKVWSLIKSIFGKEK